MRKEQIPVESVININDPSYVWYPIKGFPGYEICENNYHVYIRSLKSSVAYPYGTLLRWSIYNRFTLTNSNNQRVNIKAEDLMYLEDKSQPRSTITVDRFKARNNRIFINPDETTDEGTIVKKPRDIRMNGEKVFFPKFDIPDINLNEDSYE